MSDYNDDEMCSVDSVVTSIVDEFSRKSLRKPRDWKSMTVHQLRRYRGKHFRGKTRGQVQKIDRGFYDAVRTRGCMNSVFLSGTRRSERDWSDFDVDKSREYYWDHHLGLSRAQVHRKDIGFYNMLRKNGWVDAVLPNKRYRSWTGLDLEGARKHYTENFAGMGRQQVAGADGSFYAFVLRQDWADKVFPPAQNRGNRR